MSSYPTNVLKTLKVWDEMEEKFENDEHVTAHVTNVVKGGLTCDVDGLNGFIPASHASVRFQRDLSKYVDQDLECEIIDFDKSRRKFVLSRKNVEATEIEEKRKEVYATLEEGQFIEGTVQRLTNFGAFVDVGGVDGLIHISELSWNRVKHPSDVVSPGEKVKILVLKIDEEKNRIALGLKQTTQKPWDTFVETVQVGDDVKGTVVNILDFGAFVRLESGVDGLLHVSDIAWSRVEVPSDVLNVGDKIEVKILKLNKEKNRISLGRKQLLDKPFDSFVNSHEVGDVVKGKVVNLLDFGAFVEVADGVEGLVHVSEISWDHVEKPSDELNVGDEIEVKIISIDKEEEKVGLSIKQLEEAPERPERKPRRENRSNNNQNRPRRKAERSQSQNFSSDADLNNNLGNLLEQALLGAGETDLIGEESEVDGVIDDIEASENVEEHEEVSETEIDTEEAAESIAEEEAGEAEADEEIE